MRDLSKVEVLRDAKDVVRSVYRFSDGLPDRERFGLRSQMERAAVSIAANIAEGYGRGTPGDLERFLRIAAGSGAELSVLIELAVEAHDLHATKLLGELDSVRRQLTVLTRKVAASRR